MLHPRVLTLLLAVIAIGVAALSYRFIEAPILALKSKIGAGSASLPSNKPEYANS